MQSSKTRGLLILITLIVVAVTATIGLHGQDNSAGNQQQGNEADEEQLPITDFETPEPSDERARMVRRNRSRRYNRDYRRIDSHVVTSNEHYHWPADFPRLPVAQSDAVVVGTVSDAQAHLSEDRGNVYSEFTLRVDEVIKNDNLNHLINDGSIIVEREGGRVRFPSGHIGRYQINGFGMPRVGRRYVLFLMRDEQDYRILTGYELRAGRVFPLDNSSVVNFAAYRNADEESFLNLLRGGIAVRF